MDNERIGVYVHWPFCARLCPYCDFNIYKDKPDLAVDLTEAILRDLETWREASGERSLVSLHFGGGTPSLMPVSHLQEIIDKVQTLWTPRSDIEIALEANPSDITKELLEGWRSVGIERLSVGVQSFDDEVLKFLGRNHDGATSRKALELAVDHMPRVSADLIYGWVGQTLEHWNGELAQAISFKTGHISAYQLTIEEKTAFAQAERRGEARAVDSDTSADLFEIVGETLRAKGYARYEVSNFAKSQNDQSRHNRLYWQGDDYVGVGPGAHGRLTIDDQRFATVSALKPSAYITDGASFNAARSYQDHMSREDWAAEYLLMGMRVSEGISLQRFQELSGKELDKEIMIPLVDQGLLTRTGDRLKASEQGRLVLDTICHQLLS